jgi:hypothetical protein
MDQERLAELMQDHQEALCALPEDRMSHGAILNILRGLSTDEITLRQALRLLSYQALRLNDPPAHRALYRQAAVDLLQMGYAEELHLAGPATEMWLCSPQARRAMRERSVVAPLMILSSQPSSMYRSPPTPEDARGLGDLGERPGQSLHHTGLRPWRTIDLQR